MNLCGDDQYALRRCTWPSIKVLSLYRVSRNTMAAITMSSCVTGFQIAAFTWLLQCPFYKPTVCWARGVLLNWPSQIWLRPYREHLGVCTCPYLCQSKQDIEIKHLLVCMLMEHLAGLTHLMKPWSFCGFFGVFIFLLASED